MTSPSDETGPDGADPDARGPARRLDYICLQPLREGQASYAHVKEIVAGLERRGWRVRLVEPPLPRPGRGDGIRRALAAALTQVRYWTACGFRPARVVYIRAHFLALPTAVFARLRRAIVVQEVNGPLEDAYDAWPALRRLHRLIRLSLGLQYRWADAIVVVTDGLARNVADAFGRTSGYHVIGNGADVERFVPAVGSGGAPGAPYVVFVGALASWQGVSVAVEAAGRPEWPAGVGLVIAGDGQERDRVAAAASTNSLVRWLGTVPYAEAPALVAGSLAALAPMLGVERSRFGLSPLKVFEAMACGVPVVASDLPELGALIHEHECGITVAAGDAAGLARAVAQLAGDPTLAQRMGSRGRTAVVERYSWDARAGQTEQVLLRAARPRRDAARRVMAHRDT